MQELDPPFAKAKKLTLRAPARETRVRGRGERKKFIVHCSLIIARRYSILDSAARRINPPHEWRIKVQNESRITRTDMDLVIVHLGPGQRHSGIFASLQGACFGGWAAVFLFKK